MEEKVREYKYDNLKCILIFLVVFGHLLEFTHFDKIYMFIYTFHMPLFIYISGYFSKRHKKAFIKPLVTYLIFQTIYFIIDKFVLKKNVKLDYTYPNWILWYLFALAFWNFIVYIIDFSKLKKIYCYIVILISIIISLICGFYNEIGYSFSFSRIITFFPYFLFGYFCKNNNIKILDIKDSTKKEKIIKICLIISIALISIVYFLTVTKLNKIWFYGSFSYENGGYNIIFRLMNFLFSLAMIFLLLNFIPNKQYKISNIGKNTLYIYLFHGMIIKILNPYLYKVLNTNKIICMFTLVILTAILVFGIDFISICIKNLKQKISSERI